MQKKYFFWVIFFFKEKKLISQMLALTSDTFDICQMSAMTWITLKFFPVTPQTLLTTENLCSNKKPIFPKKCYPLLLHVLSTVQAQLHFRLVKQKWLAGLQFVLQNMCLGFSGSSKTQGK